MKAQFASLLAVLLLAACSCGRTERLTQENASLAARVRVLEYANAHLHDKLVQTEDAVADAQDSIAAAEDELRRVAGESAGFADLDGMLEDAAGALDDAADAADDESPDAAPLTARLPHERVFPSDARRPWLTATTSAAAPDRMPPRAPG